MHVGGNELRRADATGQRRPVRRFPRQHERGSDRVFGRLIGPRLRAAALAGRRARLRIEDQTGDHRLWIDYIAKHARRLTTSACSSATATTTRYHGARAPRPARDPGADRRARRRRSACRSFSRLFRGVRALDGTLAGRARDDSGGRPATTMFPASSSAIGIGRAAQSAAGARSGQKLRHPRAVRDLCRPDRSEQGLHGAVQLLPGLPHAIRQASCRSC